jgi:hypothetical protein
MPVEPRGPAVCNSSDSMGGKGVMIKAPGDLQDQKQKICTAVKAELRW